MTNVNDVIVKKQIEEEAARAKTWPTWECQPSEFDWAYTQTETCLILEGEVTVRDEQGEVNFGPGDMVIFPVDLECTWQVKKPVKKHYNFG